MTPAPRRLPVRIGPLAGAVLILLACGRAASASTPVTPLIAASPIGRSEGTAGGASRIHLRAGFEIDPARGEPALPLALRETLGSVAARRTFLVDFGDGDPGDARSRIVAAGGTVVGYVPDHAMLVRLPAHRDLALGTGDVWVGAYYPAYKLDPGLTAADAPASTIATVLVFPDGDLAAVAAAARAGELEVVTTSDNGINKLLRVRGATASAVALARHADVEWIEPYVAPIAFNDQAQGIVQTGTVGNRRVWDMGLHGEGQVVMISDTGLNPIHDMFRDPALPISVFGDYPGHRKVIAYRQGVDDPAIEFGDHGLFHGTHTACSIAGNDDGVRDDAHASPRDGMAKGAKLYVTDLSGPSRGNALILPDDLNDLYLPSYTGNAGGAARIASNSWGSYARGAYTLESFQVDQFMWSHPDYLVFFAAGNNALPMTTNAPGTAKNCVTMGASGNSGALNTLGTFTSRGPAADGRTKPTLCAPGAGVTSAYTDSSGYQQLSGTSMATPIAAGCTALMRQYLVEGWYPTGAPVAANGFSPSAALLKAMAVTSADNAISGYNAPDPNIGWGRIDADHVLYFAGDSRRLLLVDQTQGLGHRQFIEYRVNVVDGSVPLEMSLCWTDYPGAPAAAVELVNDLDLTVSNGSITYQGNVFSAGASVTGGNPDRRNVEECVRVPSPSQGVWTIRVEGANVPLGPQPFALAITGGLGATAGALMLDRAAYGPASSVQLRLIDTNAIPPVTVHVTSPTQPSGVNVALSGEGGMYTGSFALTPLANTMGELQVSSGDVVTAIYQDASPIATVTASASVSFTAPTITDVHATNQGEGRVLVTWTTDQSATSRVEYGTNALLVSTAEDGAAVLQHTVTLEGLTQGRTYDFDVESRDLGGNVTHDDHGGQHYRVTVSPRGELLLVYDGGLFDRHASYVDALAATGWTYDVWQGAQSETPLVGNSAEGLRSYTAVWWQNGLDHLPPFSDAARDSLSRYLSEGGRLAITGNQLAWGNGDTSAPSYTPERASWLHSTLHTDFVDHPDGWTSVTGVAGDPISDLYTGGLPYTEHRAGAAGDEIQSVPGPGNASDDWLSGDATPSPCGFRWESSGPLGTVGNGRWGGQTTRLATLYFEWSGIDFSNPSSPIRRDILEKTLEWLIGRGRPHVAITAPGPSDTVTAASVNVTWTEATFGGTQADSRTIEYTTDDGQSWTTITTTAGPSPFLWNLSSVPNAAHVRLRVRVTDSGTPSLAGVGESEGAFTIQRPGGDTAGPVVVAGSIHATPNPIRNHDPAIIVATFSDGSSGGAEIAGAEWSFGATPASAGHGEAMIVSTNGVTAEASAMLTTTSLPPGIGRLWVRGRDAAGNWGPAASLELAVTGTSVPSAFALGPAVPNPVTGTGSIAYSLPYAAPVKLGVYDVFGRKVRDLVDATVDAGAHVAVWDLTSRSGQLVEAGVYYYRLAVAGQTFVKRVVALR